MHTVNSHPPRPVACTTALVMLTAVGLLLRILGGRGELWLDEIWSLNLTSTVQSAWGLFWLRHDNNHLLNSLWLYLLGPGHGFYLYRALAICCSSTALILSVALAFKNLRQLEALVCSTILAFSYVLVLYGSEARGYAYLMLFLASNIGAYLGFRRNFSVKWLALFWVTAWLGILSHLSFLHFYLSLLLADVASSWWRKRAEKLAALHLPASAGVALFCWHFIPGLQIGGGPMHSSWDTFFSVFSIGFGGDELSADMPHRGALLMGLATSIYVLACTESLRCIRDNRTLGILLIALLLVVPLGFITLLQPKFITVRYLLPTLLGSYLAMSLFCARLIRRDRVGKVLAFSMMILFCCGNLRNTALLLDLGRGKYSKALERIASAGPNPLIGARQVFQVDTTLQFYRRGPTALPLTTLQTLPISDPDTSFDWIITANSEPAPKEQGCALTDEYGSAPLSGFTWHLWRCHR